MKFLVLIKANPPPVDFFRGGAILLGGNLNSASALPGASSSATAPALESTVPVSARKHHPLPENVPDSAGSVRTSAGSVPGLERSVFGAGKSGEVIEKEGDEGGKERKEARLPSGRRSISTLSPIWLITKQ